MNKELSITLLFIFTVVNLFAQHTITGVVVDSEKQPLESANVVLFDIQLNKIITGTTTNEKGAFEISHENANRKISISYIGFQTWQKEVELNQNIDFGNIILKTHNTLDEVTFTARKKMITKEGDKTIFNVQNSPFKEGYEIIDLLKVTPHVWINADNTISIRGENVTLMVNERKVDISFFSDIKSDDISRIEVQTYQSANIDATTTGGVVNFILKKKDKGVKTRLTTSYTFKPKGYTTYSDMNIDYGTERWNIYGSYSFGKYDVFTNEINNIDFLTLNNKIETESEKEIITDDHYYKIGYVNQLHKNHEIGFEVYGIQSGNDNTRLGGASYYNNYSLIDSGNVNVIGNGKNSTLAAVLNYKWKVSDNDALKTCIDYFQQNSNDFKHAGITYKNGSNDDNQKNYDSNAKTEVIALQLDYNKVLRNKTNIDFGIKYTGTNRFSDLLVKDIIGADFTEDTDQTTDINFKERISATFISADKKMGGENYLKVGIRMEYTDVNKVDFIKDTFIKKNYTNFFPSLFFSRDLTENQSLSLSYSRSLQRPNFFQLNENIEKVNDFQYYIGNPDLNPEFTDKFELNYNIKKHKFSAFYKSTQDKITEIYIIKDEIAFFKTMNMGAQKRYGVEYGFKNNINKWWFFSSSIYLFNESYVDEQGHSSFLMTTYGGSLFNKLELNKTTSLEISGFYRSPSASIFYKSYETYSMNMALNKTLINKKLNLRLDLYDIFNTFSYRTLREFETFKAYYRRVPNSRAIKIKLTYNFSNNKKVSEKKNMSQNDVEKRL